MAIIQNTLSNLPPTTGNVFFVDSGSSRASDANRGQDPNVPMATIDAAIARCTANNGDIIVVMPGHSEDPTSSITMDVAGVWIYGLGWGASRPTITFGAAAATVAMSAASCRVTNLLFDLGTVATTVTNCFNITGADCIVEDCEILPHATSQFTNLVTITDAPRVVLRNNRLRGLGAASGTSGVVLDGCDDVLIEGNEISGHFTEHALDNTTAASVDEALRITVKNNIIYNYSATAGDLTIEMDANATGIMIDNRMSGGLALDSNVVPGNVRMVENYLADADDTHGVVVPTTASA